METVFEKSQKALSGLEQSLSDAYASLIKQALTQLDKKIPRKEKRWTYNTVAFWSVSLIAGPIYFLAVLIRLTLLAPLPYVFYLLFLVFDVFGGIK